MSNEILQLRIKTQPFLNKFLEQKLNGFVLNYKKIDYLISVHHNLPIDSVYNLLTQESLNIKINSCWSEVMILETQNIDLSNLCINYKIQNKLPKVDQIMFIKTNNERYLTQVIDHVFIPFNSISDALTIPYIRSKLDQSFENVSGLSGSPVFLDDKLVGVFSKFDVKESIAYIIPIYIILKNLMKIDNFKIYGLPIDFKINKINSYNINNGIVYHPTLKINIPIDTYLILEGDINSKISVRHDSTNIIIKTIPIKLDISNESFIVNKLDEYKINVRLLILLKKFNVNKKIIMCLFEHVSKKIGSDDLWFTILNNNLKLLQ